MNSDDIRNAAERLLLHMCSGDSSGAFKALTFFEQDAAGRITDRIRRWGYTKHADALDASRFGRKHGDT